MMNPTSTRTPKGWGSRHGQALLMFFCLLVTYSLRVNLSVAVVPMMYPESKLTKWSPGERGMVLSSFFWGYMVLQIPIGTLTRKFGPCRLLVISLLCAGLANLLTPVAAIYGGWLAVSIARVCNGLVQGCVYPCFITHISQWAVPNERNRVISFCYAGAQLGSVLMMIVGGQLAASSGGWQSIFYVSGCAGILWAIICWIYGADSPEKHRFITPEEEYYVTRSLLNSENKTKLKTPWKAIAKSVPMWALLIAHCTSNWGFWTLLTLMPTYINGILHFNIQENGLLSALPYFTTWFAAISFGIIADYLIQKQIISVNFSRKMWNSVAQYGQGLSLLALAFLNTTVVEAVALLTVSVSLGGAINIGFLANHLDLSPNFVGTLMGITNSLSNVSSILGPLISSYILTDETDVGQWKMVFLLSSAVYFVGNTIFIIFGSTKIQPWNESKRTIQIVPKA